jgi:hypothetical protein
MDDGGEAYAGRVIQCVLLRACVCVCSCVCACVRVHVCRDARMRAPAPRCVQEDGSDETLLGRTFARWVAIFAWLLILKYSQRGTLILNSS